MTEERVTPLRQRMIEDMNIRGLGKKTQKAHIRNVKHFSSFLGRSPDTATAQTILASLLAKAMAIGMKGLQASMRERVMRFIWK